MPGIKLGAALLVVFAIAMSVVGCGKTKQNIHFDGYYSNQQKFDGVLTLFRYYPDGTVVAAFPVTANNVTHISPKELDKDSKECTIRGKYTLKGNSIKFNLVDSHGTASFVGEFRENTLVLKAHSNINGKDSEETYNFYK